MNHKSVAAGLALVALGMACSPGREQYKAPNDQRKDNKAELSGSLTPSEPTNTSAGLVDGWYVEPTPEQQAKIISDAIRAPIEMGQGLAGINISMSRSDIETKIGQADFVAQDQYGRPVAVYGGGSFYIYYDRASKNKVEMLLARNGYLGRVNGADLSVGSDLAPLLATEGGESGLLKKLYKQANPGVENCEEANLCRLLRGPNLALMDLTNTVSVLYQDDPTKPEKKIFEIRISQRIPAAGRFADAWNYDVLSGALSNENLPDFKATNPTWGEVRKAGELDALVEPRDFGRSLTQFSVTLDNDLGFSFSRSDSTNVSAKSPLDSDTMVSVSVGASFTGSLTTGNKPLLLELCKENDGASGQNVIVLESFERGQPNPIVSTWKVSVVTEARSVCASAPLTVNPSDSLFNAAANSASENTDRIVGRTNAIFDSALGQKPNLSLGLARSIFNQTFNAIHEAAKANSTDRNVLPLLPEGSRSLEESATYVKSLQILDTNFKAGRRIDVFYFESSKNMLIQTTTIASDYHNVNTSLSVLQRSNEALTVDLDQTIGAGGINIQKTVGGTQVGTLLNISPFDRSLRYAKVGFAAEDGPILDLGTYADNFSFNMTDGTSVVSKTSDLLIATRGLYVSGDRVDGRSDTVSTIAVTRVEVSDLPLNTQLSLSCKGRVLNITVGADFDKVYDALNACSKFLNPGYFADRVPSELHVAPEGQRTHGLTLSFTEGLLTSYAVYNVN